MRGTTMCVERPRRDCSPPPAHQVIMGYIMSHLLNTKRQQAEQGKVITDIYNTQQTIVISGVPLGFEKL